MQHAAAVHDEGVGGKAGLDAEREVFLELALETLLQVAGSDIFSILSKERGIIDGEEHAHRRLVDGDRRQGLGILVVGDGIADLESVNAHKGADIAATGFVDIGLAQAFEDHELLDLLLLDDVIPLAEADVLAASESSTGDAADSDTADIRGILQGGDKHLRSALYHLRCGNNFEDGIEQGGDIRAGSLPVLGHPALLGAAENGLEIKLLICGVEVAHEVEDLLLHLVGTAVELIDLIHDDDGLLAHLKSLLEDETCLGHATLESIHQEEHSVGHVEDALDLTSEIAMSGSVYDVDLDPLVDNGDVLGQDGDATLALKVVVVEDELSEIFGLADKVGLIDHAIDQRGLAVVDVGDDRYVSDFLHNQI